MSSDSRVLEEMMSQDDDQNDDHGGGTVVVTRTDIEAKEPSMYKVVLHNDDYTPMEFVVMVLEKFFSKKHEEATEIMLHVHNKGYGICGIYPYEIAETKVALVSETARDNQYPLKCTMEKA